MHRRRGFIRSLGFSCLHRNASFEAATGIPSAKQGRVSTNRVYVNLALRSWNKVEVSIKHRVYGVCVLCLFLLLFLLFHFFHFLHFLETGKVNPLPQTGMPVFWQMRKLTDGPLSNLLFPFQKNSQPSKSWSSKNKSITARQNLKTRSCRDYSNSDSHTFRRQRRKTWQQHDPGF